MENDLVNPFLTPFGRVGKPTAYANSGIHAAVWSNTFLKNCQLPLINRPNDYPQTKALNSFISTILRNLKRYFYPNFHPDRLD
ncbi:hypothetical protein [Xanthocytophaga flavus]|nr:hypothetical protein [Xanthocytophaga flavus]